MILINRSNEIFPYGFRLEEIFDDNEEITKNVQFTYHHITYGRSKKVYTPTKIPDFIHNLIHNPIQKRFKTTKLARNELYF